MGKRKKSSRKPMGPKKRETLATTFQCLFCNHENSVTVKVDKKSGIGQLSCKVCGQSFQTTINYLSAPIDVYSDWIDACEAVQKQSGDDRAGNPAETTFRDADIPSRGLHQASSSKKQDDLDDFIEDDDGDMEGGYLDD